MSIADTPVTYPIPPLPRGWRMAAVHAGIKRNATREDVTLVASDQPATAAGVYTTNLVFAAPVALDRSRTPGTGFRGVVINSGNANACTGSRGLEDARQMAALAARELGAAGEQVLVSASTVEKEVREQLAGKSGGNLDAAKLIGERVARKALAAGISQVAFDRGGFRYHGRVKALADAAREAGLKF